MKSRLNRYFDGYIKDHSAFGHVIEIKMPVKYPTFIKFQSTFDLSTTSDSHLWICNSHIWIEPCLTKRNQIFSEGKTLLAQGYWQTFEWIHNVITIPNFCVINSRENKIDTLLNGSIHFTKFVKTNEPI